MMKNTVLGSTKHVHVVGIAGIGMSAIAEFLLNEGFVVSGSDNTENDLTERLKTKGAQIYKGHKAENITTPDVVVHTSAVKANANPETIRANELGIPVIKRYDLLRSLLRTKTSIGIAGTHGKTTTTAMTGLIFIAAETNPTVLVGGQLPNFDNLNLRFGKGEYFVIESDEYDRTFLQLGLQHSIINNVEADHLDIFGTEEAVFEAFTKYANELPFYGNLLVNGDDAGVQKILPKLSHKFLSFGFKESNYFQAKNMFTSSTGTSFIFEVDGKEIGTIDLSVFGKHNVSNALAAASMAWQFDISFEHISKGLASYSGVQRRFQILHSSDELRIVDDYAHHPTEVAASIQAAKDSRPDHKIIAVFQPHLYSRTSDFYKEFASALSIADIAVLAPLYPARENPVEGVSSHLISNILKSKNHKTSCFDDFETLGTALKSNIEENATYLFMGAGNITQYAHSFANYVKLEVNA